MKVDETLDANTLLILEEKASRGDLEAHYRLGKAYEGEPYKDLEKAFKLFEFAAKRGHVQSQTKVALFYDRGLVGSRNIKKAVMWYAGAAESGDAEAQYHLALCYIDGRGVPHKVAKGISWLEHAEQQNHSEATFRLGYCYEIGAGEMPVDLEHAAQLYIKASEMDCREAMYRLGRFYEQGVVFSSDQQKAHAFYAEAMKRGHKRAGKRLDAIDSGAEIDLGVTLK